MAFQGPNGGDGRPPARSEQANRHFTKIARPKPSTIGGEHIEVAADGHVRARVLTSFQGAEGGTLFAHQLQNDVSKGLGLAGHEVYVDNRALRDMDPANVNMATFLRREPGESSSGYIDRLLAQRPGESDADFDLRRLNQSRLKNEGDADYIAFLTTDDGPVVRRDAQEIGARHKDWDKFYRRAMAESDVMVVVLDDGYEDNPNTRKELMQYRLLASQRKLEGLEPPKLVVLDVKQDTWNAKTKELFDDLAPGIVKGKKIQANTRRDDYLAAGGHAFAAPPASSSQQTRAWTVSRDTMAELYKAIGE